MMSIFQDHVLPNAKEDLAQSELVLNEHSIDPKEKEFVSLISQKSSKELTPKDVERLKHITRKSISASVRVQIWLLLSGGADVTYQSLYQETCEELFTDDGFIPDGDNNKDFLTYYLSAAGGKKLRRLLCVLKHLNPDITHCPLLEPIVSILLHFMDEEAAFSCASGLLSGDFVSPFLDQTKIENVTTDATIQDLLKSHHKKSFNRIKSFLQTKLPPGKEKEVIFPTWRWIIFENMDFVCLTRIVDCLMIEGVKILYRVGLYLLEAFYLYSQTFEQLHCHSTQDLVITIGQYTMSMKIQAEELLKAAMKINITTKQIVKAKQENTKLYKADKLEWQDMADINQVVAVDLRQVSDIIKPHQWHAISEWLPARIQIMQPLLLFSTNRDGYKKGTICNNLINMQNERQNLIHFNICCSSLKTLYLMCEEEEQTLMIIQTSTNEIFGAYLSESLTHRHDGKNNMSFFGTGETFLFKLSPNCIAYHWHEKVHSKSAVDQTRRKKKSTYVFVDTKPLINDDTDNPTKSDEKPKRSRRLSVKKTLTRKLTSGSKPSFNRTLSSSAYLKRDKVSVSLHPLNAINMKRSAFSVPKRLYLESNEYPSSHQSQQQSVLENKQKRKPLLSAQTFDIGDMKKLQKSSNFEIIDNEDCGLQMKKLRSISETGGGDARQKQVDDTFDIIEEESALPTVGISPTTFTAPLNKKKVELFISCDNSRIVIGGGGSGSGIRLDGELSKGSSFVCETFQNKPLTDGENGDFTVMRVDVFGFQT